MTSQIKLISRSKSGRTGAYYGNLLPGPPHMDAGLRKTHIIGFIRDFLFNQLNCDGVFIDSQHATCLTGSRANPSGKFGKIIGAFQDMISLLPFIAVYPLIKLWDDIPQGTTLVAKRHPAIHTPSRLPV